jgi:hypothetical protein
MDTDMDTKKYPRTLHFPFPPGAHGGDRIAPDAGALVGTTIVITEKLDGENTCLSRHGVFARSRAAPTRNPWARYLKPFRECARRDPSELEVFGESVYAVHSIEYTGLEQHSYVFAVREGNRWLAWDDVAACAGVLGLPTVPVLFRGAVGDDAALRALVEDLAGRPSALSDRRGTPGSGSGRRGRSCTGPRRTCRSGSRSGSPGWCATTGLPLWFLDKDDPERAVTAASPVTDTRLLALLAEADARGRVCADADKEDLSERVALFGAFCRGMGCWGRPRASVSDHSRFVYFRYFRRRGGGGSPDYDYAAYDDTRFTAFLMSGLPDAGKDTWLRGSAPGLPVVSLDGPRRESGVGPRDDQGR